MKKNIKDSSAETHAEIKSTVPAVSQPVSQPVAQTPQIASQHPEDDSSGLFSKFRENPWVLSNIILGAILLVFIFYGKGGISGNVVSEDTAAKSLISFIESQSQGQPNEVNIVSTEQDGQLYKITVDYQGQNIPLYVSLDGKYLISNVIPLDLNALTTTEGGASGPINVEIGESPIKGKADAPVTIIEFSDYQCPYCGRFFTETLPQIEKNYIDTGKVKFVYKDFPLNFHENAQKAAEAARCVREQKGDVGYFKMHDKLYANQENLSIENYKTWARSLGVNMEKFNSCLESGKFASNVKADLDYGQSVGVSGTPAFFINGVLLTGAQPYSVFEQAIKKALNEGTANEQTTVQISPSA